MSLSNREDVILLEIDCRITLTTLVDKISTELNDSRVPVKPEFDFFLRDAKLELSIEEIFIFGGGRRLHPSLSRSFILNEPWTKCADWLLS